MPAGGWTDSDIKTLRDAIEYHGKLSNRVIDDLADGLHRTPEAVRAKVRQLKLKDRAIASGLKQQAKAQREDPGPDGAALQTDGQQQDADAGEPSTQQQPAVQQTAVQQPDVQQSAAPGKRKNVQKKKEAASYMELVEGLSELDELTKTASSLDAEAARVQEKAAATRRRALEKHSELALKFPGAQILLDRFLPKK